MRGQPTKYIPPEPPKTVEEVVRKAFGVGYALGNGLHMNGERARRDALARLDGLVDLANEIAGLAGGSA